MAVVLHMPVEVFCFRGNIGKDGAAGSIGCMYFMIVTIQN
jgi:hypothetical protein